MLEKVPIPCQFAVHGCKTKLKMKDQNEHAAQCPFREVHCTEVDCDEKIPLCKFMGHIESCHFHEGNVDINTGNQHESYIELENEAFSEDGNVGQSMIFLDYNDQLLCLELHRIHRQKLFLFWIFFIGTPKEATKYTCEITIFNEDKAEKHIYSGPPISIDVSFKDAMDSKQGLVIEDAVAKRLLNVYNELKFKIQIKDK